MEPKKQKEQFIISPPQKKIAGGHMKFIYIIKEIVRGVSKVPFYDHFFYTCFDFFQADFKGGRVEGHGVFRYSIIHKELHISIS